ncbi:MFS transporter [Acinetobacter sp. ANC 4558]|uniref:MFS transporter n=1 Tax=Acinetobacter sp. ANC 4558 TaxID=1977876 RepID=UPI00148A1EB5|nr:MFS transporter [Acinetobacter sp. ANC 4558]
MSSSSEQTQVSTNLSETPPISKKAVAAAVTGNALEFYDFVIYAYFAVYIGKAFFPVTGEYGSLMAAVATFGVGFFARPLGGILIGSFADRAGRKPAMILTVGLITVGTLGLAITPSYESIGIIAPIIVVICRLMQGLALGGEIGPATSLLIEAAPAKKRGFYSSWQIASQGLAVAVGGTFGVLLSINLTTEQLADWGWRVPFLLSLVLIPIAIYIRRTLPETHENKDEHSSSEIVSTVFREHKKVLILGILLFSSIGVASQIGNYMVSYAVQVLKLSAPIAQGSVLVGGIMTFISALIGGILSDRFGRKVVNILPRIVLMLLVIPIFTWMSNAPSLLTLFTVNAIVASCTAMFATAGLVQIPELLPIAVRSTGLSLVYAFGTAIFGGTTQFIVTWLIAMTDSPMAPAWYVVGISILSLVALVFLPESKNVNVQK